MLLQTNKITKMAYQGMNQPELQKVKKDRGYQSDEWVTYVQARTAGQKLENAKGQGVHLRTFPKNEDTGDSYPKYFVVFNCDLLEEVK